MSLMFRCNRCDTVLEAFTGDWEKLRAPDGTYPRDRVHSWLGERVMTTLAEHTRSCPKAEPGDDGRPILRLVVSN